MRVGEIHIETKLTVKYIMVIVISSSIINAPQATLLEELFFSAGSWTMYVAQSPAGFVYLSFVTSVLLYVVKV